MTQSNDSDSITMRLSVMEIVKLYDLVQYLKPDQSVKIEQNNGSGIGNTTIIHLPPVDLTSYDNW